MTGILYAKVLNVHCIYKNKYFMETNSFHNASFNDIIFHNRNKDFGAYQLRNDYEKHIKISLLITYSFIAFLFLFRIALVKLSPQPVVDLGQKIVCTFQQLTPLKPLAVPVLQPKTIAKANTERFTEMHVTQTPVEIETPPTQNSLSQTNVGTTTNNTGSTIGNGMDETGGEITPPSPPEPVANSNKIFDMPEIFPEYIGGEKALYKFLTQNIEYPNRAKDLEVEGKVILRFVIGTDGKVENVELLRGIGYGCDEEAVRVVKMLKFTPGFQGKNAVKTRMVIPIKFSLH